MEGNPWVNVKTGECTAKAVFQSVRSDAIGEVTVDAHSAGRASIQQRADFIESKVSMLHAATILCLPDSQSSPG